MLCLRRAILFGGILIVAIGIFVGLRNMIVLKQDTGKEGQITSSVVPTDEATVVVSGWSKPELDKIISDFAQKYRWSQSALPVKLVSAGTYEIQFPNGIAADDLMFLVNYLHYPEGFELKNRAITAVGLIRLGAPFGLSDKSLIGDRGVIYVPSNDIDYDQVYVKVASVGAYRVPFTTLNWVRTDNPRLPASVAELSNRFGRDLP